MAIDSVTSAKAVQQLTPETLEPKGKPDHDGDKDDSSGGIQSIPPSVSSTGNPIGLNVSVKA